MEKVIEYCSKHNRDKIPSKFPDKRTGEKTYWCPECYDEWKKTKQPSQAETKQEIKQNLPKADPNALIIEELSGINQRLEKLIDIISKLGK